MPSRPAVCRALYSSLFETEPEPSLSLSIYIDLYLSIYVYIYTYLYIPSRMRCLLGLRRAKLFRALSSRPTPSCRV